MPFQNMTTVEKIDYVTNELLPMLQNDLRVIVEGGCNKHGIGTGANFAIALLCLVACETVGALAAKQPMSGGTATKAFITRVGKLAGDRRYGEYAGLLFAMFRNGVGHSFLPKQCAGLHARTVWIIPCVEELRQDRREAYLHNTRITLHLRVNDAGEPRTFDVVTKILYLDVSRAIENFAENLRKATPKQEKAFEAAFDRWVQANADVRRGKLTPKEAGILNAAP